MNPGAHPTLGREIARAGEGLARLLRADPRWTEGFDLSGDGFLRSFLGPLLALPFYLLVASVVGEEAGRRAASAAFLWAEGVSHVTDALAYPLAVFLLVRALGLGRGYAAFIIIGNWASLFLNMALAAASLFVVLGPAGIGLFNLAALVLFAASVFVTWRAARQTLTHEIAPALLMVVVLVAVSALADQVGVWVIKGWAVKASAG